MGAEVIVCPTAVAPDDPRSYYSVARRLASEIPNSVYINQYDHPANTAAHVRTTGPEIWEGTDGKVTHFIAGAGTGGTISGTAKYLKSKNPNVQVIGVDPHGSVYWKYFHTREFDAEEIHPYITEGVGEDILAGNMDFDLVDDFVRVSDREAMIWTRRLCREEGMFVGGSCGMVMAGALQWLRDNRDTLSEDDVAVVLLPDGGFRYLGKIYNDAWMQDHGFLEESEPLTAAAVLDSVGPRGVPGERLVSVPADMTLADAIDLMTRHGISQVPVTENGDVVGSLVEQAILTRLISEPDARARLVGDVMGDPFPVVEASTPVRDLAAHMQGQCTAVLVRASDGELSILTRTDLISTLGA
jgi:cystathionine beta-synthase